MREQPTPSSNQIHWPEPNEDLEEGWETLVKLKEEGKVRYIGVSNCSAEQMERVRRIAPITSTQPPYSIVQAEAEQAILPYAQQHGIGVIVYAPMKSGLLTGAMTRERLASLPEEDWRRRSPFFKEPMLTRESPHLRRCDCLGVALCLPEAEGSRLLIRTVDLLFAADSRAEATAWQRAIQVCLH